MMIRKSLFNFGLLLLLVLAAAAQAQVEPDRSGLGQAEFRLDELNIEHDYRLPHNLPGLAASIAGANLAALGLSSNLGRVDVRGGRWATLLTAEPLLPGKGVGNQLSWSQLGLTAPRNDTEYSRAASQAFRGFLDAASSELQIDLAELGNNEKVTLHEAGDTIQIYIPRVFNGIPVRGSYITASINNGNLVLFGTTNWGEIDVSTTPAISAAEANDEVQSLVGAYDINGNWGAPELMLIPVQQGKISQLSTVGAGYGHRLAWVTRPAFDGEMRRFEAVVDAHTGEVMSFVDTNQYVATPRESKGGVLPVSNDGISPDGVEQAGWPMPFNDVTTPGGTVTTDSGGNLPAPVDGNITSTLVGPYVKINDNCGAISLTSSGDIDFGTSAGTDCTTPGTGGAGNTHAARTGFHELNRIIEMGRSHLPGNAWLQQQLISNMNINNTCNAFWNGTVNFYRSGGGCFNTGELAGVFDHEWGHGLDSNDATPGISSPSGEGIADVYTALRLNSSCIGRNFRATPCTGFGDACKTCTGVRDIDYLQRISEAPHTYTWSNTFCGGSVHCVGSVYAEAVWSLWKRELQAPPYSLDDHTAHEIVTRLTFIGAGNTGTWFSGGPPNGGCAANSGYMNYLAADDDNGNLADGTPHMAAIFAAFDDQEIACATPTVVDAGCAGTPTAAPVVTANALDKSVNLTWGSVAGASSYEVFRTEGVFGCDFGKVKAGETAGTSFNDTGLQNDRDYSYVVIPKGTAAACFGNASACTTVAPAAGPNVDIDVGSALLAISTGDADEFIDNCEDATLTFDVNNTGLGGLSNVRLTGVAVVSPAGTTISTSFPAAVSPASLPQGASGSGSFAFTGGGLAFGDDLVFEVSFTADEISPTIKTAILTLNNAESDLQAFASKTWDFETDLDGWTLVEGIFNQSTTGGGANGSSGFVASSSGLNNQCDQVRSPVIQLTPASTMSLENNYDIEANSGQWWDRANIGVVSGGTRSAVDPDGGRLYNASGAGATCATVGQNGWADTTGNVWAPSSWSAAALGSAGFAGSPVQLDVAFGTDVSVVGTGFKFDQVTLTDIEQLVADTQTDSCGTPVNQTPVVTITAPADGSNIEVGVNINFTGTANDTEDGNISASIDWTSDIDGAIGSGASINTASLSAGVHTITAEVTDSGNPTATPKTGNDQITITVNQPPTVTITAPADGSSSTQGDNVNFTATATDPEDGNIGANINWNSSIDGAIGSGASINITTLSVGIHTVTADATDSGGLNRDHQITFTVDPPPPAADVHVELVTTGTASAPKGKKYGTATVTIYDENENAVGAGYTVTGNFSGSFGDVGVVGVTNSSGVATFQTTGTAKKNIVVGFCVSDVSGALPYDAGDNESASYGCAPPPALEDVHIEDVQTGSVGLGGGSKAGTATVTIFGNNGVPQAGYDVTGTFSGDFNEAVVVPGTTGADGTVTFQTSGSKKGKLSVSFCVDTVSGAEPYDKSDNVDPNFDCNP